MKYFDAVVQVRVESQDGNGNSKFKRVKKNYLVDSLTVTEAEARVVKVFEQMGGVQEFNVIGVNGSKLMDALVIDGDTDSNVKFYEVGVEIKIESSGSEDNVRVKKVKENFLVEAKSVSDAENRVKMLYSSGGFSSDYEVISIKRSKVVEIINSETTDLKELPEGKWLTVKTDASNDDEDVDETDIDEQEN